MEPAPDPPPGSTATAAPPCADRHSFFRDVAWRWSDVLICFAPQLVFLAAILLRPARVGPALVGLFVPLTLLGEVWMVGYIVWVARRRSGTLPAHPPSRAFLRELRWLPLIAPCVFLLIEVVASAVEWLRQESAAPGEVWAPFVGAGSRAQLVGFLFIALVGAPIAEELSFRGLLYNKLRQTMPGFVAALLQAAAFGFGHLPLGIAMFWGTGAAGLAFGLVYEWRKTLVAAILVHSSVNAIASALLLASVAADAAAPRLGVTAVGGGEGCVVTSIARGSAADRAGLKVGDVVTTIDGQPVRESLELSRIIRRKKVGDHVTVEFIRDGKPERVEAELARRRE
jgi:membrane protease YdiL (CAAX protease family)